MWCQWLLLSRCVSSDDSGCNLRRIVLLVEVDGQAVKSNDNVASHHKAH